MKIKANTFAALLIVVTLIVMLSGCASVDRALTVPARQPVTENVTNAAGQVFPVTYTPLLPNPALQPYADTGAAVVNVLPEPYKTVGGGLLAGAIALGSLYIRSRNQLRKVEAVNNSIIAGVDTFAAQAPNGDALKANIQTIATAQGTEPLLNKLVNK